MHTKFGDEYKMIVVDQKFKMKQKFCDSKLFKRCERINGKPNY